MCRYPRPSLHLYFLWPWHLTVTERSVTSAIMATIEDVDHDRKKEPEDRINEVLLPPDSLSTEEAKPHPPLYWKFIAVLLISCISFGSSWSSGITGALKSTLKKELDINNKQFSLLEASEDFMVTLLILSSGILTDRIGGAGAMLYGVYKRPLQLIEVPDGEQRLTRW